MSLATDIHAPRNDRAIRIAIACAAVIATYLGWRVFWFLTDDAYIAFRYVSNSIAGYGYVWNPPPFRPVEGYTSFLWVVLLDIVWRLTGITPPQAANWVSLFFGYGQLYLAYRFLMRWRLLPEHSRHRPLYLALLLTGVVTNRTFLTWLSSGLETSLFNFAVIWWAYHGFASDDQRGPYWSLTLSTSATLIALTRPDGLLFVAPTLVMVTLSQVGEYSKSKSASRQEFLFLLPLLLIPVHLLWRYSFYGEWLPNTYYAKHLESWTESGIRYLGSFVVEYSLWFLALLVLAWLVKAGAANLRRPVAFLRGHYSAAITSATLVGHAGYYTFVIGGDHFEYRVYSHLIPLLMLASLWVLTRMFHRAAPAAGLFLLYIVFSWPIPWLHWSETHRLSTRDETFMMRRPIAHHFPELLRPAVRKWEAWQAWLIYHFVCMRHQEHKVFYQFQMATMPDRREQPNFSQADIPVLQTKTVGVPGWVLPSVAILDELGLNDRVVARSPYRHGVRRLAHEHKPPPGYFECFRPNVEIRNRQVIIHARSRPLLAADVKSCERPKWY